MDLDDDAPPDLVEAPSALEDEGKQVKVPITIVTGTSSTPWKTNLVVVII